MHETCPQYLLLDESCYQKSDFTSAKYVISPPLRSKDNQEKLWNGLRTGILGTVATDHCSLIFKDRKQQVSMILVKYLMAYHEWDFSPSVSLLMIRVSITFYANKLNFLAKNVVKTLLNIIYVVDLRIMNLLFFRDYGQIFLLNLYDEETFYYDCGSLR